MKLTLEQKEVLKELVKKFEYKQIEEILKGISEGFIDVNIYTEPEWSYKKMNQVRYMLEANSDIEFSDFNFDFFSAEELEEMNKYLDNIDSNLLLLKNQAKSSDRKNEILKIIQRFIERDFKGEQTTELNEAIL